MKLKRKKKYSPHRGTPKARAKLTAERRAGFIAAVEGMALPVCAAEGLELVHVEYLREADGRKLRLYIDKPGGIGLDDCVRVTRHLSDLLDVELEENYGPYNLEVSSPGPDRPLVKPADFERFKGNTAKIRTTPGHRRAKKNFPAP